MPDSILWLLSQACWPSIKCSVWNKSSVFDESPLKWMISLIFSCFKIPRLKALKLLNTRWPVSLNRCSILLAVESNSLVWAYEEFSNHFLPTLDPRISNVPARISSRNSWFSRDSEHNSHHSFPTQCHSKSRWISWRKDNEEKLREIFHSNSIASPSIPLHLGKTNTTWVLPLDLSISLSLLECLSSVQHIERNQHRHILLLLPPISPKKVMNTPDMLHSESLQNSPLPTSEKCWNNIQFPRILCSCRFPNSTWNSTKDGCRLSSTWILNIFQINTFVFIYLHWECCVVRVFHASQIWCWRNKSPCAVGERRCFLITLCWELILPHAVCSGQWNILLSIRLSVLDFWSWNGSPAVSSGYFYFCSLIGIHRIEQRSQTSWRCVLILLLAQHQTWRRFHRWRALFEVVLWPFSSWRVAVYDDRQKESHWYGYKNTSINYYVEQTKKVIPFISWETSLGQNVGVLVFGINTIALDCFGPSWYFQLAAPAQLCEVGYVSYRPASAFDNHLHCCFNVFTKKFKPEHRSEKVFCAWRDVINICPTQIFRRVRLFLRSFVGMFFTVFMTQHVAPCSGLNWRIMPQIKSGNSFHVDLHLTTSLQVGQNCVRLKLVSCTSNLWERMFHSRIYKEFHWGQFLSFSWSPVKAESWNTTICDAVQGFSHDNVVGNRLCDECRKSSLQIVCHMTDSILWLLSQACWPTLKCSVWNKSSVFDESPLKWMVSLLFFCFKIPRLNALKLLNARWPVSLNRCTCWLWNQILLFERTKNFQTTFFRRWTQESPMSLRELHCVILDFLGIRSTILIIRFPLKCHSKSRWISWRKDNDAKLGENIHSNSVVSPSIPLHLGETNTTWVLPLDLSISLSLLECLSSVQHIERNQHRHILLLLPPISPKKVMNTPDMLHSESLQNSPLPTSEKCWNNIQFPRILCSCRFPNSTWNSTKDGCRLSSTRILNIFQINTFVFIYLHWECCVVRVFHASQFWCWRNKSPCAVGERRVLSHHIVLGVDPPTCCLQRPVEHSLVDSLERTRFLILKRIASCFQRLFLLLFFKSVFTGLNRDPKLREDVSSFFCSPSTRHGVAFTVGEPYSKSSSDLFRHGALQSTMIVRKKVTDMATRIHR